MAIIEMIRAKRRQEKADKFLQLRRIVSIATSFIGEESLKKFQTKEFAEPSPIYPGIQDRTFFLFLKFLDPDMVKVTRKFELDEESQREKKEYKEKNWIDYIEMFQHGECINDQEILNIGTNLAEFFGQILFSENGLVEIFTKNILDEKYTEEIKWLRESILEHPEATLIILLRLFKKTHFPGQNPTSSQILGKLKEIYPFFFKESPFKGIYVDIDGQKVAPPAICHIRKITLKDGTKRKVFVRSGGGISEEEEKTELPIEVSDQIEAQEKTLSPGILTAPAVGTSEPKDLSVNSVESNLGSQVTTPRGATEIKQQEPQTLAVLIDNNPSTILDTPGSELFLILKNIFSAIRLNTTDKKRPENEHQFLLLIDEIITNTVRVLMLIKIQKTEKNIQIRQERQNKINDIIRKFYDMHTKLRTDEKIKPLYHLDEKVAGKDFSKQIKIINYFIQKAFLSGLLEKEKIEISPSLNPSIPREKSQHFLLTAIGEYLKFLYKFHRELFVDIKVDFASKEIFQTLQIEELQDLNNREQDFTNHIKQEVIASLKSTRLNNDNIVEDEVQVNILQILCECTSFLSGDIENRERIKRVSNGILKKCEMVKLNILHSNNLLVQLEIYFAFLFLRKQGVFQKIENNINLLSSDKKDFENQRVESAETQKRSKPQGFAKPDNNKGSNNNKKK